VGRLDEHLEIGVVAAVSQVHGIHLALASVLSSQHGIVSHACHRFGEERGHTFGVRRSFRYGGIHQIDIRGLDEAICHCRARSKVGRPGMPASPNRGEERGAGPTGTVLV
jgi:hypothetical protein